MPHESGLTSILQCSQGRIDPREGIIKQHCIWQSAQIVRTCPRYSLCNCRKFSIQWEWVVQAFCRLHGRYRSCVRSASTLLYTPHKNTKGPVATYTSTVGVYVCLTMILS